MDEFSCALTRNKLKEDLKYALSNISINTRKLMNNGSDDGSYSFKSILSLTKQYCEPKLSELINQPFEFLCISCDSFTTDYDVVKKCMRKAPKITVELEKIGGESVFEFYEPIIEWLKRIDQCLECKHIADESLTLEDPITVENFSANAYLYVRRQKQNNTWLSLVNSTIVEYQGNPLAYYEEQLIQPIKCKRCIDISKVVDAINTPFTIVHTSNKLTKESFYNIYIEPYIMYLTNIISCLICYCIPDLIINDSNIPRNLFNKANFDRYTMYIDYISVIDLLKLELSDENTYRIKFVELLWRRPETFTPSEGTAIKTVCKNIDGLDKWFATIVKTVELYKSYNSHNSQKIIPMEQTDSIYSIVARELHPWVEKIKGDISSLWLLK
mgnify:CR=1 FL=1